MFLLIIKQVLGAVTSGGRERLQDVGSFRFPLDLPARRLSTAALAERQRIILVVEDEWLVRMEIAEAFEGAGWIVFEASSGEEAIAFLAEQQPISLLLTDIRLIGAMTGWDVAEAYRAQCPDIPVIYASANPSIAARRVSDSLFIEKPSRISEIVAASERLWLGHQ